MNLEKSLRLLADDVKWIMERRDYPPQEIQRVFLIKARMENLILRLQVLAKDLGKEASE